MGYLAAKDTGAVSIKTSGSLILPDTLSTDGVANPSSNFGVVDLRSFSFGFNTGMNVDDSPNIAGKITRLAMGGTKPIPFELSCYISRKTVEGDDSKLSVENINTLNYLLRWNRARTIVMLFWMPNTNDTSWLSYGQDKDFFTSQLRTVYDVVWDWNTDSSTAGWQGTNPTTGSYGTNHFRIEMSGSISNYDACAIPVIFSDVSIKEDAESYGVQIKISGYCLEEEQRV